MQLDIHEAQGVTVLTPTGRITMGDGDVALREAVYDLLETGARNILIDLGHVTFIDSFGIGQLIDCYTTVTNQGGLLKLCDLSRLVSSIMQITKLNAVFEVFKSEAEAMDSF